MRSFKLALGVSTTGDPSALASTTSSRRRDGGSSAGSSVSAASSVAGSPLGRRDSEEDEDELLSYRSNASSSTAASMERDALLNLPLDKEFVPLAHHEDDGEEADVVRDEVRNDVIRMIFDLPHTTKFYQGRKKSRPPVVS